jgi:GTP-binding protein HflX
LEDEFEIDGIQTPRIFVSARDMNGIPLLRQRLARIVSERSQGDSPEAYSPEVAGDDSALGTI